MLSSPLLVQKAREKWGTAAHAAGILSTEIKREEWATRHVDHNGLVLLLRHIRPFHYKAVDMARTISMLPNTLRTARIKTICLRSAFVATILRESPSS